MFRIARCRWQEGFGCSGLLAADGRKVSDVPDGSLQLAGSFRIFPTTRRRLQEAFGLPDGSLQTAGSFRILPTTRCRLQEAFGKLRWVADDWGGFHLFGFCD